MAGGDSYDDDDDVVCPCLRLPGQESDRECGECKFAFECDSPQAECATNCIRNIDEKKKHLCSCIFGTQCKGSLCDEDSSCFVSEKSQPGESD